MVKPLSPDWREFFAALQAEDVRFVVVGALAVAAHAEPRYSEDLDVFVEPTLENAARLAKALRSFGFESLPSVEALARTDEIVMLGRKPFRIDVLKSISGVSFHEAWRGRLEVDIDGLRLPVLGRAELIVNKRASGRNKDLRDLALLEDAERRPPGRASSRKRGRRKR